jgi:uncharacterized membrane protein YphA (DoxX/SURF4 family)
MSTKIQTGSRYLLGVLFFVFGLNGFLQFLPQPPLPESAMGFLGGLMSAKYFFPFLKGTEVLAGLLLLTGQAVPVALIVLAPITLNILLFHSFLTPGLENVVMPLVMVVLHVTAAARYSNVYKPLFGKGE